MKTLYTAHATATGGREGRAETNDGQLSVTLSRPGGNKPGTNPEQLFACGYAACFGGALDFVAKQQKLDATKATIECAVSIGPRESVGFGLAVKLKIIDKSLPQAQLTALANEAHEKICPYSNATRNNVDVQLEVVGG